MKNYKLARAIDEAGYSANSLSIATGLNRKTIYNAINGKSVRVKSAILMARALDKAVEDLFDAQPRSVYNGR